MVRPRIARLVAAASLILSLTVPARASDPPAAIINPLTGVIETVDAAWCASQYDIRHVVNPGGGAPLQVSLVSQHPAPDLRPRVACSPTGFSWVVWWRDASVDSVHYALRDPVTGSFSAEIQLSSSGQSSRNPVIVHDGSSPWVAYEADSAGSRVVYALTGGNDPAPWPTKFQIGVSSFAGDLELTLDAADGRLWTSWVDSADQLAWSRYDDVSGTWSVPAYESSADGRDHARRRIRQQVLTE